MSRRVDRVELQRLATRRVDDVVLGSGRNDDRRAVLHLVLVAVDDDAAPARLEAEELVAVLVHLQADVLLRRETHQNELATGGGIEDFPEITVFKGQLFDVVVESLHPALRSRFERAGYSLSSR